MRSCKCNTRFDCSVLAITAGLIVGIVVAILRYTAVITIPTVLSWVAFGIAAGTLIVLLILSASVRCLKDCECPAYPLVVIGALLAIATSLVLLVVTFGATSVLGAIITGILWGSFALIFTAIGCIVRCVSDCTCNNPFDN